MVRRPKRLFEDIGEGIADAEQGGSDAIDMIVNSEAGQVGVDIEHHVRGGFMGAGNTPSDMGFPHKKQKATPMKMGKPMNTRTSSRRKTTPRRSMKRKPRRTRPIASRRMKGLKTMIKRIALDTAEPKRHLFGTDLSATGGVEFQTTQLTTFRIDDVPLLTTSNSIANETTQFSGREFYLKGVRIRGYFINLSQYPISVRALVWQTKAKITAELQNFITAGLYPGFYNPLTGQEATIGTINSLYRYSPKIAPKSQAKVVKSKTFILDGTRRTPAAAVAGTEIDSDPTGTVDDLVHFDMYLPFNKVIRHDIDSSANTIFDQHIQRYISFHWNNVQVNDTVLIKPRVFFSGITYFKDI